MYPKTRCRGESIVSFRSIESENGPKLSTSKITARRTGLLPNGLRNWTDLRLAAT